MNLFHNQEAIHQKRLLEEVQTLFDKVNRYFHRQFAIPEISFTLRGTTAGLAYPERNKLKFNNELLTMYGETFIADTVAHEIAHLIAYQMYGKSIKPHGKEWQSIMVDVFASEPKVTHKFSTSMNRKQVYLYSCQCNTKIEFSRIRHSRAQRGTSYICRRCRGTLHYTKKRNNHQQVHATQKQQEQKQKQMLF